MVARLALALVALLMVAWMAVLLRDYELGYDALANRDPERLEEAKLLDPSRYWHRIQAGLYLVTADNERAVAEAEAIVREEPDNINAWTVLYHATRRTDPRRAAQAADEIRRLDPFAGGGSGSR